MSQNGALIPGLCILAAIVWGAAFFSNIAILTGRDEFENSGRFFVRCKYLNAAGTEEKQRAFDLPAWRDSFFCPRHKQVGAPIG